MGLKKFFKTRLFKKAGGMGMGTQSVASSSQKKRSINQKLENAVYCETTDNTIHSLNKLFLSFILISIIFLVINYVLRNAALSTINDNTLGLDYSSDLNVALMNAYRNSRLTLLIESGIVQNNR